MVPGKMPIYVVIVWMLIEAAVIYNSSQIRGDTNIAGLFMILH